MSIRLRAGERPRTYDTQTDTATALNTSNNRPLLNMKYIHSVDWIELIYLDVRLIHIYLFFFKNAVLQALLFGIFT